ncbi:MAG TPA: DUF3047 domain-containing protein [Fodinibius sp.]|nr:DUF3047 domain-containing protein [Fodinibius sp.]
MRYYLLRFILVLGYWFIYGGIQAQHHNSEIKTGADGSVLLEDFESYAKGTIPDNWYNQRGTGRPALYSSDNKSAYKYRIGEEDGNKFLRYEGKSAKHLSLPLVNRDKDNIYDINIYETPILSWKVRARKLPENANEKDDDLNDSVASLYVFFDMGRVALFKKVPKTIRYTWSSTLEKGTELSKFFGNQKVVVVESGPERTGQWITFKRNIVKDYKRLFGDKPPKYPKAILLLSDGDSTGDWVKADYDDIKLLPDMNDAKTK